MKHSFIFFTAILLVLTGCGNPQVKGTVKFDDGTPLTTGGVVFNNGRTQAVGAIKSDGNYVLYELQPGDGVNPGTYAVAVTAQIGGGSDGAPLVDLIDPKFADSTTSGLTCEVKGTTTFNITVTKP